MSRSLGTLTLDLVLEFAGFKEGMDRAAREVERSAQKLNALKREGAGLKDALQTPFERFQVEVAKYSDLLAAGAIDQQTFERAVRRSAAAFDAANPELKEHNALLKQGQTLTESLRTPQEQLNVKLAEYDRLLKKGAIDQTTYNRAVAQARSSYKTAITGADGFAASLGKLRGLLGTLGVALSFQAIIQGLKSATAEAIKFGDELEKASARTGIAAESFSSLAAAAKQSDVEMASLGNAFRKMQQAISAFGTGSDKAEESFKALGLSIADLRDLTPDKQFIEIARRLAQIPDPADRARVGIEIFGKAWSDIAPFLELGAEGIRAARVEMERLGATSTDEQIKALAAADDAVKRLTASYEGLKRALVADIIAAPLTDAFEAIAQQMADARKNGVDARTVAEAYFNAVQENGLTTDLQDIIDQLDTSDERFRAVRTLAQAFLNARAKEGFWFDILDVMKEARIIQEDFLRSQRAIEAMTGSTFAPGGRNRIPFVPGPAEDANKPKGVNEAEQARKAIDALIVSLKQQSEVTGETEQAMIEYRLAFGDLVDDFKKAGPAFEERKQQLIDAAAAADQFKAGEELDKANEQAREQVIALQAARIALDDGAAAAFRFSAQHGELAKTLDLATDSQAEFTDRVEEGANAIANVELQQAITTIDGLVRSTEEATQAIIANTIAEEQGAVASIRYQIAQGNLRDEFEKLGPAAAEWQKRLEDAAAAQEVLTQRQAEDAASESIIPSRTKALKEYDDAIAGLTRRLQEGEISQKDFDKAVEIAKENFEDATKAIDDMSVFAEQAARNMQDAFADFLFDPFESGLDGMVQQFSDTLRRMAAEIVAAQLAEKFNFEDIFKGGGIFGGGGGVWDEKLPWERMAGGGLSPIEITAQRLPIPGAAAAVGEAAGESAAAAAFTAAGTAAAAALTTAGATTAAAFTTAGTAAATALVTSGTTVSGAIIAAGTTAAAAIGAAATAGSAAGGLSEIVITAARLAEGGKVRGPGTPTSDSIPTWLSAGEFVVKAAAVRQPGVERLLTEINNQTVNHPTVLRYAAGGKVAPPALAQVAAKGAVPVALRSLVTRIEDEETEALTRSIARTLNERFDTTRHYAHADVLRDELERWSVRREREDVRRDVRDHRSSDIERLSHLVDRSETARSQFDAETHRTAVREEHLWAVRRREALFETTRRVRNAVETALSLSLTSDINERIKRTVLEDLGFATGGRVPAPVAVQAPWSPATPTDEHHRTFDAHTTRTAVEDVHRLLNEERRLTVERLLERTAAPIIVDLREDDLRRPADDFERLLGRLGLVHRAEGGKVVGPGSGTSDSIPAWLSAGEFVVKAAAVRTPGVQDLLERLNSSPGVFRSFASGGYVYSPHTWNRTEQHFATGGMVQASAMPTANPPPTVVNQNITVNAPSGQVSRATEMQITAAAARGAKVADRRNN